MGPCWFYPDHKAPRQDEHLHPVTLPANSPDFFCEGRDGIDAHTIPVPQYMLHAHPDKKERHTHLRTKIGIGHPEPFCFRVFELDEQVGVSRRANDALAQIRLGDAETVRGVIIQTYSPATARQLAGQLRDKLPWCEHVKLNRDGTLAELDWHGGRLTPGETAELAQQQLKARILENELLQAERKVTALRRRKKELGL